MRGRAGQAGEGPLRLHDGHVGHDDREGEASEIGDGVYEGMAKFTMGGPWAVVVQIDRPGKPTLREKFIVRVSG